MSDLAFKNWVGARTALPSILAAGDIATIIRSGTTYKYDLGTVFAAVKATADGAASQAALDAQKTRIDNILATADPAFDTFVEVFNKFMLEDSEQAAMTAAIATKLTTPASPSNGNLLGYAGGVPVWVAPGLYVPAGGANTNILGFAGGVPAWRTAPVELPAGAAAGKVLGYSSGPAWITGYLLPAGGTTGQVPTKLSSTDGDVGWSTPSAGGSALIPTDRKIFWTEDDFLLPNIAQASTTLVQDYRPSGWTHRAIQGGYDFSASSWPATDAGNYNGVYRMNCNANTAAFSSIRQGGMFVQLSKGRAYFEARIASRSSIGTDRFENILGIMNNASITQWSEVTAGVGFRYCDNVNGGLWQAFSKNSGGTTVVDCGVGLATSQSIFVLQIEVNAAGTSIDYYINGTKVATITTNIDTTTVGLIPQIVHTRIAATSPAAAGASVVSIDRIAAGVVMTTGRGGAAISGLVT